MSTTSRASGRSPSRNLPFTLHVSVYAIVPLALAFLASAFIWDIFCFNCDRQQEWRAAVPETAKVRNPNAPAGAAASKAIQGDSSQPEAGGQDGGREGGPADEEYEEVLDYLLELALMDRGTGKKNGMGGGNKAAADAGAAVTQSNGGQTDEARSAGRGGRDKGDGAEDDVKEDGRVGAGENAAAADTDAVDGDYEIIDDAEVMEEDAGEADDAVADGGYDDYDSVADEADDVEEESSQGAAAGVAYDDYDAMYGGPDSGGAGAGGVEADGKKKGEDAGDAATAGGEEGAAEAGVGLDEPEAEDDYESLYGGDGAGGGGGAGDVSPGAQTEEAGDESADEADGGADTSHLDEPAENEDYEPLYGEDGGEAGGNRTAAPAAADGKAAEGTTGDEAYAVADEADDVEDVGPEDAADGGSGYKYGFKLLPPASVAYGDVAHCPEAGEPPENWLRPVHPGMNLLMVVGVQKGGTTWMANALMKHPSIMTASYGFSWTRQIVPKAKAKHHKTKEVHYLDRWPHFNGSEADYISLFPRYTAARANATAQLRAAGVPLKSLVTAAGTRAAYDHLSHEVAFFDASPNYLPIAHVPPRASIIMPHARIVIVLRDPVARALSAYNMDRGRFCGTGKPAATFFLKNTECPETAFSDTVEEATGVEARGDSCAFDGQDRGGPRTWHDCFKCSHMFFNRTHCRHLPEPRPFNDCKPDVLNYVQVSNYAAQIAWWLAFYPPEQILIITSSELRDPDRQALNRILKHAKLPNAKRFSKKWLESMDINGFQGTYDEDDTAKGIPEAIATLRQRFQKPVEDLRHLINRFWPNMKFTGLQDEV